MLSQCAGQRGRLHTCAFFSRRFSQAEWNNDMGDRELLAVKLALEEWQHHLECLEQPFFVWTDHKNLSYIQAAELAPGHVGCVLLQVPFHDHPPSIFPKREGGSTFHASSLWTTFPHPLETSCLRNRSLADSLRRWRRL